MRLALGLAVLTAAWLAPLPVAAGDGAAQVSYVSIRTGDAHIYRTEPGGREVKLTSDGTNNNQPSWSSDGKLIAFTSNRSGLLRVFLMNADGSGVRALTGDARIEMGPTFSPDGRRVAFYSQDVSSSQMELRIVAVDSGATTVITAHGREMGPTRPSWSADGRVIAFPVHRAGKAFEVWVANSDGTGVRALSDKFSNRGKGDPAISPDGRRVAFVADMRGPFHLIVTDLETGTSTNLTPEVMAGHETPKWSPDGRSIAFASTRDDPGKSRSDIFVMSADGSGVRNLTQDAAEDFNPHWAPDGSTIFFTSLRTGTAQLFAVDVASGRTRRITNNQSHDLEQAPGPIARY